MRETRILEFKETITNTFLKTVSAFSNYDGGTILFGVDDDGNVKGLSDVKQACLDIENKINDSISPQPNYMLEMLMQRYIKFKSPEEDIILWFDELHEKQGKELS